MSNITDLIRKDLHNIKPYPVNRTAGKRIWLDSNELPWEINASSQNLNRYPTQMPQDLQCYANYYGVGDEQIVLCRGSSDGIDLLIRLFCQAYQDSIIICSPTFVMYATWAKLHGVKVIDVPLINDADFCWDFEEIKRIFAKLIFICSPNNPSGTFAPADELVALCHAVRAYSLVVVDEAYIEFSTKNSMISYLKECPNLVVLRTFSKAFGLAGIRLGCIMANEIIIDYLKAIIPPYALPAATLQQAQMAMQPEYLAKVKTATHQVQLAKEKLKDKLSALPFVKKVWPSEANFLLVEVDEIEYLFDKCLQEEIVLKRVILSASLQCLRITIGSAWENERLLQVLRKI